MYDPDASPIPDVPPDELTPEQRVDAAARAHYTVCRSLLAVQSDSAYLAELAGVDPELIEQIEESAEEDYHQWEVGPEE